MCCGDEMTLEAVFDIDIPTPLPAIFQKGHKPEPTIAWQCRFNTKKHPTWSNKTKHFVFWPVWLAALTHSSDHIVFFFFFLVGLHTREQVSATNSRPLSQAKFQATAILNERRTTPSLSVGQRCHLTQIP